MKSLVKLGLIDDEFFELENLKGLLKGIPGYKVSFAVTDPKEGIKLARNFECDILMTDIEMDKLNGLIISEEMEKIGIPVIVCSAYEKYALDSINLSVAGYLVKPVKTLPLKDLLNKVKSKFIEPRKTSPSHSLNFVMLRTPDSFGSFKIYWIDIYYIEQIKNYTYLYSENQTFRERSTLEDWASKAPEELFIRVHNAIIVNFSYVTRIVGNNVELSNGKNLPLSYRYRKALKEACNL